MTLGFVPALILMSVVVFFIRMTFIIHPISGNSMEHSLSNGDWVLINKRMPIERYTIVAFSEKSKHDLLVKRIIGQPGDTYVIQDNMMTLDLGDRNKFQTTMQIELEKDIAKKLSNRTSIPENSYFVMGDNVDISNDSRSFGLISDKHIEGKMERVLWTKNR